MPHVGFFLGLIAVWAAYVASSALEHAARRQRYTFSAWLLAPPPAGMLVMEMINPPALGFWMVGLPHAVLLVLSLGSMLRSWSLMVAARPPRAIVVRR